MFTNFDDIIKYAHKLGFAVTLNFTEYACWCTFSLFTYLSIFFIIETNIPGQDK